MVVVVVVVVVGLRDGCQGAGWASQSGHLIDVYHWDSHSEMGGGGGGHYIARWSKETKKQKH